MLTRNGRRKVLFGTNYPIIFHEPAPADPDALALDHEAREALPLSQRPAAHQRTPAAPALPRRAEASRMAGLVPTTDDNQQRTDSARRDDRFVTRSETPRCARFARRHGASAHRHGCARAWGTTTSSKFAPLVFAQIQARQGRGPGRAHGEACLRIIVNLHTLACAPLSAITAPAPVPGAEPRPVRASALPPIR
jgi:hypothetical protein